MSGSDEQHDSVKPTEQRGGGTPSKDEARTKGSWAAKAGEGVVPAELGGSDAPPTMQADDPELESSVLGVTTGSDVPATESGVDLSAGDDADATSDGGPAASGAEEPDLKDAAAGPRQADVKSVED